MFNLGLPEILLIGAAALLVFGPKRLPELAKGLGKGIRDFKKALEGKDEEKDNGEGGDKKLGAERLPPSNTVAQSAQGVKTPEPTPAGN